MFIMNFDDYKNTMPYPSKPKKPHLNISHASQDVQQYFLALKKWESEMEIYRKEVAAYQKTDADLYVKFMQDIFDDLGIANNPKRDRLFSIAWDMGHSAGYSEVYHYASELVDLIRD
jgi:phosphomannomutase